MTTLYWRGDAVAVAQVATVTLGGTWEATDIVLLTIGARTLSVVAGDTDVDVIAATVATAWNDSTVPEFAEVTAAAVGSGGQLTLTGDTAGVPFICTVESTETGGGAKDDQTIGIAATTAAEGPNVWCANNFVDIATGLNALPAASDVVYFDNSAIDLLYGLDQSAAGTLAALYILSGYTGKVGLPKVNETGAYHEYRPVDLEVRTSILDVGRGAGPGSARLQIGLGTVQCAVTVSKTASSDEAEYHALRLTGSNAGNTLVAGGGTIDLAARGDETAQYSSVTCTGTATLRASVGATIATLTGAGGARVSYAKAPGTAVFCYDSAAVTELGTGSGETTAAVYARGGVIDTQGLATWTLLEVSPNAAVTAKNLPAAGVKTITDCTLDYAATLRDPASRLDFTNPIDFGNARLQDVTLEFAGGRTWQPG